MPDKHANVSPVSISTRSLATLLLAFNSAIEFQVAGPTSKVVSALDRGRRSIALANAQSSKSLILSALGDITNPAEPGNGKGFVSVDFPKSVYENEGDEDERRNEDESLRQLAKFLQVAGPDNGYHPLFPVDEFVLMFSHSVKRGPLATNSMASRPVSTFHVDAPGGPDFLLTFWFFPYSRTDGVHLDFDEFYETFLDNVKGSDICDSYLHAAAITDVCMQISQSSDPKAMFELAGILTFNAWWVTEGSRALSFITQPAFANFSNGKSLWHFFDGDANPKDLIELDPSLKDDVLKPFAEDHVATEGKGFLFNSALVPHRASDEDLGGTSREVRIAAIPIAILNTVVESDLDWSNVHVASYESMAHA